MASNAEIPTTSPLASSHTAPYPFDKPNADCILRTSDNVDFRVFSQILIVASPVFERMLENRDQLAYPVEPHIIDVAENSNTVEMLLGICYPLNKPHTFLFKQFEPGLRMAIKYEMELSRTVLVAELRAATKKRPMGAWAAACRLQLEDVALEAAKVIASLSDASTAKLQRRFGVLDDTAGISAGNYYRLATYCRLNAKVPYGFEMLAPLPDLADVEHADGATSTPFPAERLSHLLPPDVICSSSDGIDFLAHRAVLAAASPILSEMVQSVAEYQPASLPCGEPTFLPLPPLPILRFDEDKTSVGILLELCYPYVFDITDMSDLSRIPVALTIPNRYGLGMASPLLESHWQNVSKRTPMKAYCAAILAKHEGCTRQAARVLLEHSLEDLYEPELEHIPALSYHRLRVYHEACGHIAKIRLKSIQPSPISMLFPITRGCMDGVPDTWQIGHHWVVQSVQHAIEETKVKPRSHSLAAIELFRETTSREVSNCSLWCEDCRSLATDIFKADAANKGLVKSMYEVQLEI